MYVCVNGYYNMSHPIIWTSTAMCGQIHSLPNSDANMRTSTHARTGKQRNTHVPPSARRQESTTGDNKFFIIYAPVLGWIFILRFIFYAAEAFIKLLLATIVMLSQTCLGTVFAEFAKLFQQQALHHGKSSS